jgi:Flp pilus assembly pilin Flp
MLKAYNKARNLADRLFANEDGVVSLEYVVVAAAVVLVVYNVFNGTGANTLTGALTTGFGNIVTNMKGG